jgi:hypothetical protein
LAQPIKRHWTTYVGQTAGHPAAFVVVIVYALLWLIFSPARGRDAADVAISTAFGTVQLVRFSVVTDEHRPGYRKRRNAS